MSRTKAGEQRARTVVERAMSEVGYSTAALAREAGIDPGTVGDFLLGKRWPRREKLAAMERVLLLAPGTVTKLAESAAGRKAEVEFRPERRGRLAADEGAGIAEEMVHRFHPSLRRYSDAELIRELRARMLYYAARLTALDEPTLTWALSDTGDDEVVSGPPNV